MRTVEFNGRQIKTNLNGNYPVAGKYQLNNYNFRRMEWVLRDGDQYRSLESDKEMFERLAKEGYSKITFYRITGRIRGYYEIVANCKW